LRKINALDGGVKLAQGVRVAEKKREHAVFVLVVCAHAGSLRHLAREFNGREPAPGAAFAARFAGAALSSRIDAMNAVDLRRKNAGARRSGWFQAGSRGLP